MDLTRRSWVLAATGLTLAALAVLFARSQLLYGAAAVGAFLMYRQLRYLDAVRMVGDTLAVEQSVTSNHVDTDGETVVTLSARLSRPTPLGVTVTAIPPLFADGPAMEERTIHIEAGDRSTETTFDVNWPVVGRGTFSAPQVTTEDRFGLFRSAFERGTEPTVTVDPRIPRNVHIGEGGTQVTAAFGGHRSDRHGRGIDPAELRQYVPGDSVSNIDWKATARLDYPHVREYEVETDQQTILFVDQRGSMGVGSEGRTKLDYLREVALTVVGNAQRLSDPLGVAGIGPEGTTRWNSPSTDPAAYDAARTTLHDLEAIGTPDGDPSDEHTHSVSASRRKATLLAGDGSQFSSRIRPFLDDASGYVQQLAAEPLFETVRTRLTQLSSGSWILLFADDTARAELREAAKLGANEGAGVVVFMTPSVLFERDGLVDLDTAYDEYVDFEEFRRELSRIDGVSAFEVAPSDRIEAVLTAGRRRR
ncbi:DUF58 domain-containing protein [Natronomonas salsuginis]|uniref:DUF58 domain-containing protein n=1 Tax=Natronomonas salsuginis TaxID=2217661 RepID=A0A4U5JAB3_9EURY|nr:DUF58 domain-containing protein [Natronomonas salsuginis]TKR25475.1 DUF58 domain-containing protein [Natronomonas salsuginis]